YFRVRSGGKHRSPRARHSTFIDGTPEVAESNRCCQLVERSAAAWASGALSGPQRPLRTKPVLSRGRVDSRSSLRPGFVGDRHRLPIQDLLPDRSLPTTVFLATENPSPFAQPPPPSGQELALRLLPDPGR